MTNNASTAYDFVLEMSGRPQGDPRDAEIARLRALVERYRARFHMACLEKGYDEAEAAEIIAEVEAHPR
jgi:hypothetical protein